MVEAQVCMTFLLIASYPGSIISFRGALIQSLIASGAKVHVAAPGLYRGNSVHQSLEMMGVTPIGIPLKRTGTNLVSDLALLLRLYQLMRRIRPDVVLAYTIKPIAYGSIAAWLARVPRRFVLVTGLGYAFIGARSGPLASGVRWLYRLALSKVHKVFFQNPDDQSMLRQKGILSENTPSVVVNGSGVDISYYSAQPFADGPLKFLMIGRLLGDKGVREYVAAARQIRSQWPEVRFRLAGWIDGNPDAISQEELDAWTGQGTVEFLGHLSDVRPAISDCSVYVLPSYREGTPRTVLEAMAMGRAIITTDAPGCRQTVEEGRNGFLVPVASVDSLVKAMSRLITDDQLAEYMGDQSREIAEQKYDVNRVNTVMLSEMGVSIRPELVPPPQTG